MVQKRRKKRSPYKAGLPSNRKRASTGRTRTRTFSPRLRRLLWQTGKWSLTLAIWGAVAFGVMLLWYGYQLPDLRSVYDFQKKPSVTLISADGQIFATYGDLYGAPVPLIDLPPHLVHAILDTEDRNFYHHPGVDITGIARAVVMNTIGNGGRQGGSTITQQLAKNLFLTNERTFQRKLKELVIALWLERKLTKEEILTLYLNRVYFGAGTYGLEAAADKYFQKSARTLNLPESAMLVGLLKAPSKFNPFINPDLANIRKNEVIDNMVENNHLSRAQAEQAKLAKIRLSPGMDNNSARFFADWVMDMIPRHIGYLTQDIVVQTTLDLKLQKLADAALKKQINSNSLEYNIAQGAMVSLSDTGAVIAMVGGIEYQFSQFNRVTQAMRQPGSTFKTFVALAALDAGWTPNSAVIDAPVNIKGWQPKNFDGKFRGEVTLQQMLVESLNVPAVRVAQSLGMSPVMRLATRLGIDTPIRNDLSSALGSSETTLLRMTQTYSVISAGGRSNTPYGIERITTRNGEELYQYRKPSTEQVLSGAVTADIDGMLRDVVSVGTGRNARIPQGGSGKTGTSQNFKDAWFIGYIGGMTTGIWIGNDDGTPMERSTGGNVPARIWHDYMQAVMP